MTTTGASPRVRVEVERVQRRGTTWRVTWRIADRAGRPLTVVEAWHPHARFRSSRLARSLRVPAGGSVALEMPARVDARPGERVENCFLILRAVSGRQAWRILARFTVEIDADGAPAPRVESVDVHPAGR